MGLTGGCHCGAVRYEIADVEPAYSAVCHCIDCRRTSGAPMVGWALYRQEQVGVTGEPTSYASSKLATRQFCGTCGTSLFYLNQTVFPGGIDVQTATLDDPDAMPAEIQVQAAERLGWVGRLGDLPAFDRYPDGAPDH